MIQFFNRAGEVIAEIEADSIQAALELACATEVNLAGVVLQGSYLHGLDLTHGQFVGASFDGSVLEASDFTDADLTDASVGGTNLSQCKFVRAKIIRVDFSSANTEGADFTDAIRE